MKIESKESYAHKVVFMVKNKLQIELKSAGRMVVLQVSTINMYTNIPPSAADIHKNNLKQKKEKQK